MTINSINNISTFSRENALSTEQVSAATEEQLAFVQEIIAQTEHLNEMANQFKSTVKIFKLN
jgi:methyl-accepting chemotaxis protein